MNLDAVHIAAYLAAFVLAFMRLNDAGRPLWAWLPAWLQPVFPALVTTLPDLASGLGLVQTPVDLGVALVAFAGALSTALRGALPPSQFAKLDDEGKSKLARARGHERRRPPRVATGMLAVASLFLFIECTAAQQKIVARGVNDIARDLCADYFTKQGVSFEEAFETACSAREVLDPFIEQVLAAQQAAGARVSAKAPGAAPAP